MSTSEHRRCIAIGCHLHSKCQLPINYKARVQIWPPYLGEACEHFVWREKDDDHDND